jgi:hypothetical protein
MGSDAPEDSASAQREWIEPIAKSLIERGFGTPLCLALELFRPFSFLASQALLAVEPLMGERLGRASRQWQHLFEDRRALDALLARLEGAQQSTAVAEEDPCKPSSR